MAAHRFMIDVAAPLLKFDKLSNLQLRPSALYQLVEMRSRGAITEADIDVVLKESAESWIGTKRLQEILESLHPVEAAPESTSEAEPAGAIETTGGATTDEAADTAASTEAAGEPNGGVGDGQGEQSAETPPDTAPKPKSAPSAKDHGNLFGFTTNVLNLKRLATGSAKKYVATAVQAADLETVADFVRAVADLKETTHGNRRFSGIIGRGSQGGVRGGRGRVTVSFDPVGDAGPRQAIMHEIGNQTHEQYQECHCRARRQWDEN